MTIKTVAVLGMGAVGSAVASYFFNNEKYDFYVAATGARAERIKNFGVEINRKKYMPKVISEAEGKIDLLIVTVKNYSLENALMSIETIIDEDTIILPLLNGIMAAKILREKFPSNRILNGIILRTDADRVGHSVTFTTTGEIQIGYENNCEIAPEVQCVCKCLRSVGLNANIYEDMKRMQWRKWMINIGCNQVSVEAGAEFKYFGLVPEIVELMRVLMDEILLIAKAEHVNLTEKDRDEVIDIIVNYPPYKKTSMLQDIEAFRRTEIDSFAGNVVSIGKKHGIPTPANYALYLAIKAKEKVYLMKKEEKGEDR